MTSTWHLCQTITVSCEILDSVYCSFAIVCNTPKICRNLYLDANIHIVISVMNIFQQLGVTPVNKLDCGIVRSLFVEDRGMGFALSINVVL